MSSLHRCFLAALRGKFSLNNFSRRSISVSKHAFPPCRELLTAPKRRHHYPVFNVRTFCQTKASHEEPEILAALTNIQALKAQDRFSYNQYRVAISICAKHGRWRDCISLLQDLELHPDTTVGDGTYQTVINVCARSKRPVETFEMLATMMSSPRQGIPASIFFTALSSVSAPVPAHAPFRDTARTALAHARRWLASPMARDSHASKMQSYKILFRFCALDQDWRTAVHLCDDTLQQWQQAPEQDWSHLLHFFFNTAETCKAHNSPDAAEAILKLMNRALHPSTDTDTTSTTNTTTTDTTPPPPPPPSVLLHPKLFAKAMRASFVHCGGASSMQLLTRGLDLGLKFDQELLHTTFASQRFPPLAHTTREALPILTTLTRTAVEGGMTPSPITFKLMLEAVIAKYGAKTPLAPLRFFHLCQGHQATGHKPKEWGPLIAIFSGSDMAQQLEDNLADAARVHETIIGHLCQTGNAADAFALYKDIHLANSDAQVTDETLCSLVRGVCVTPWVDLEPHVTAKTATELLADLAFRTTDPEGAQITWLVGHALRHMRGSAETQVSKALELLDVAVQRLSGSGRRLGVLPYNRLMRMLSNHGRWKDVTWVLLAMQHGHLPPGETVTDGADAQWDSLLNRSCYPAALSERDQSKLLGGQQRITPSALQPNPDRLTPLLKHAGAPADTLLAPLTASATPGVLAPPSTSSFNLALNALKQQGSPVGGVTQLFNLMRASGLTPNADSARHLLDSLDHTRHRHLASRLAEAMLRDLVHATTESSSDEWFNVVGKEGDLLASSVARAHIRADRLEPVRELLRDFENNFGVSPSGLLLKRVLLDLRTELHRKRIPNTSTIPALTTPDLSAPPHHGKLQDTLRLYSEVAADVERSMAAQNLEITSTHYEPLVEIYSFGGRVSDSLRCLEVMRQQRLQNPASGPTGRSFFANLVDCLFRGGNVAGVSVRGRSLGDFGTILRLRDAWGDPLPLDRMNPRYQMQVFAAAMRSRRWDHALEIFTSCRVTKKMFFNDPLRQIMSSYALFALERLGAHDAKGHDAAHKELQARLMSWMGGTQHGPKRALPKAVYIRMLAAQGDWKRARKLLLNWHRQHQDYLAKTAKAQGAVTAPATAFRGPGPHCFQCVANACRAAGETDAAETLEYHYT